MKTKIINQIVKNGFNKNNAIAWVEKYFDLAERRGCETVKEFADDITWFAAVA